MSEHTDDLRNVRKNDTVRLATTEGESLRAQCINYTKLHADERTGEVRETRVWTFESGDREFAATIIDGLRSSPTDPEFPLHKQAWDVYRQEGLGYIEDLTLFGEMEQ